MELYNNKKKKIKKKLSIKKGVLGLGSIKFRIFCSSCSKSMLLIIRSWVHIENEMCAFNPLKYVIFIPEFAYNELEKSSDVIFQK